MILEEQELEYRSAGSTTFNNEAMGQAVEADTCFYIEHEADVRGRPSIDLAVDPPPDLAIEIDLTVWTRLPNHELLGVPELCRHWQSTLYFT